MYEALPGKSFKRCNKTTVFYVRQHQIFEVTKDKEDFHESTRCQAFFWEKTRVV
jgi:hypothetical protein